MFASSLRFLANGWVERFYVQPQFFFSYWGLSFIRPLPEPFMSGLFGLCAALSLMVALGLFYRPAIALFFLAFTYIELCDVSNYLNHYYLISLLSFLMIFLPLHRYGSLDARLRPSIKSRTLPAWVGYALRLQVAVVYFYAAIAKLNSDWLLHAQPLNIWLSSRTDLWLIGPYLDRYWVAMAMSWAGFLYDLTIWVWLSLRRTRPWAYLLLIAFHTAVGILFKIGMFPFIMTVAALVFFEPDWPRRAWETISHKLGRKDAAPSFSELARPSPPQPLGGLALGLLGAWALIQVAFPLRAFAYGGDVLWHEQGMRWSWRVMVREKNGSIRYRVRARELPRERVVSPRRYLSAHQEREMSGQPDLILQLAHHIAEEHRGRGLREVEVRVDAWVSLNGRPMRRLIDPDVDLVQVRDGVSPATWITDAPSDPPIRLRPLGERGGRVARAPRNRR
jgi:hypothetical protein